MSEQTALTANAVATIVESTAKPIQKVVNLAQIQALSLPVIFTPKNYDVRVLDNLEKHLPTPLRKTGSAALDDLDSFVWYVKEHGSLSSCRIYVTVEYQSGALKMAAVFNDHDQAGPQWRDFTAIFKPALSLEWQRWSANNRKAMSQAEFATFIEDSLPEIATVQGMPTGSDMMTLATTFEATSEKRFKSGMRLQSGGMAIEYVDQEDAGTLARMQMFEKFALGMPIYFNGTAYRIDARLKYRVRDGKLALWYELIRPEQIIKDAAEILIQSVREQTGMPTLFGQPAA